MKIELVVAAPDEEYLRALISYVHQSEASKKISLRCFSLKEKFINWLKHGRAETILIDHTWYLEITKEHSLPTKQNFILLEDEAICSTTSAAIEISQIPTIFKYQSAAKIINELLIQSRSESHLPSRVREKPDGASKVLAIYSIIGGCGKTTLAMNVMKQLIELNRQVLYVSLELFSTLDRWIELKGRGDFSKLVYYMHNRPEEVNTLLDGWIHRDEHTGIHYIPPLEHITDIRDLSKDDVIFLVDAFRKLHQFDHIILDLDAGVSERAGGGLLSADMIWWLVLDDLHGLVKTKKAIESWLPLLAGAEAGLLEKAKFIHYRSYGASAANPLVEQLGRVDGSLPYIPEWKQMARPEQLWGSVIFNNRLSDWLRVLK